MGNLKVIFKILLNFTAFNTPECDKELWYNEYFANRACNFPFNVLEHCHVIQKLSGAITALPISKPTMVVTAFSV